MVAATYILIPVLGSTSQHVIEGWKDSKAYSLLKQHIGQHFDEAFEHVTVLYEGNRSDMFVGETSSINGRHIRNIRATEIYRAASLARSPHIDPESLPAISGPAVLFIDRLVWK